MKKHVIFKTPRDFSQQRKSHVIFLVGTSELQEPPMN